ncbi:MAG: chromate efflux transporter [Gemmatimonadaceae bacterium]|nr:chromate efflux transporter [Gemmatimonadaceae bacterium]
MRLSLLLAGSMLTGTWSSDPEPERAPHGEPPRDVNAKAELPGSPVAPTLASLLAMFAWLGTIGFGGGMAVIALVEREVVTRRRLMAVEEFLHGVALSQILGPAAVNMAIFVGSRAFGVWGGLACAGAFMAPSITFVILLSWLYFAFHAIPTLQSALVGLGPVVIALILSTAWTMGRKAVRTVWAAALLVAAIALVMVKLNAVAILAIGAGAGLALGRARLTGAAIGDGGVKLPPRPPASRTGTGAWLLWLPLLSTSTSPTMLAMAWVFLKAGFVFFGGGFVLIPLLNETLVSSLGWLTTREFLDGVAISNLTPGPIAVLATFTGYRLHGVSGALVATLTLFLPAMTLMSVLAVSYQRLKELSLAQQLLAGLTPVVIGLIVGAAVLLATAALGSSAAVVSALISLVLLIRFKWHPVFVLMLGALSGIAGLVR